MSVKTDVIRFIEELPDNTTMEEILYKLYVKARIEEGMMESDKGQGIPHEEAMEQISKWLS